MLLENTFDINAFDNRIELDKHSGRRQCPAIGYKFNAKVVFKES